MSAIETRVPDDDSPTRCPHCGRPFRTDDRRDLHVGERHPEECTDTEQSAYETAREAESEELFVYHLKVVAAIVLLFFAFTYSYTFVWT